MPQTITQKILAAHCGKKEVVPGEVIEANIDVLMMHDITSSSAIKLLKTEFKNKIAQSLKVVVVPDHYVPNKDIKSAILYQELFNFAKEHNLKYFYSIEGGNYGVCHVMLPEEGHILPGNVIVGGDSHTCTYGALGAFSTGIGTTEVGNVLATGKLWFRVPKTIKINVSGKMPKNVMAKDIFLKVVGDIGVDGALYQAMEWCGDTIENMSIDERFTLTNMAIEAGAKSGIIAPDKKTLDYISKRNPNAKFNIFKSDKDANYEKIININAGKLVPLVAKPDLPSNVVAAKDLKNIKINQAYIGGCTGGKWNDFVATAQVLKGKKIAPNVRLLIVPSTAKIQRKIVNEGLYNIFMDAGGIMSAPTCGACLGGYMGVLGPKEVAISSTNRNFKGRMGDLTAEVYLASPKTVAASAIKGYIEGSLNVR
ncbi:MAG: 3-isopropylmalate dehydratase large subunit [Candidatus Aenigmarchaeota archaeon ex4484_52]|nr:MAG: 3-isopropylmalate dehydratase large subunit [Candidatus Aenigmarchaeota archaeon ex4484_52]